MASNKEKPKPKGLPYASVLKGEFPSLSNTSQLANAGQSSMWSSSSSRNLGGSLQRTQNNPHQGQADDIFSTAPRLSSAQGSFRFGNQPAAVPSSQAQPADEFPPLNRNANGEIGQERGSNLMSALGFGSQTSASASTMQGRSGNGLLNALSANSRAAADSRASGARPQDARVSTGEDEGRQKTFREDSMASQSSIGDGTPLSPDSRNPLGAIGNDAPSGKGKEQDSSRPGVKDPLEGMAPIDKWGLKGLRTLMNNYPDYNAIVMGIDPTTLGFDLNSNEMISTQIYSLFDDAPPRPAVPKFRLPDCYQVKNVHSIEDKIPHFNEETLMWIFYSHPGDAKQHLAAIELTSRNWRWHKKLQIWLTKDEMMVPQALSPTHERGYYIIWDTNNWRKERREFTLHYSDLETNPQMPPAPVT
ncbi:hypothetical protein GQ53DRAFT_833953 [Thozetella sp. PMI_491]|nr:hypothetical protein GQ53DRAFT_833953 [Thozetella sp. PMI_491]